MFGFFQLIGGRYSGLRMSADEFLRISDEGFNYELVDGVVTVTPSPTPEHQDVNLEIATQLRNYLRENPIGKVLSETDVHLGQGLTGGDIVYRPEVVFYMMNRIKGMKRKLHGPPDLVVEVISAGSHKFDTETKRLDYERFGVGEYWLIDPETDSLICCRLEQGRFVEIPMTGDRFESRAVPGFVLDIGRVRQLFGSWPE